VFGKNFFAVEVFRQLGPMKASIVMVNDMVAIIECSSVHECVNAIVRQSIVALRPSGVHEHMLRPIAKTHGKESNENWHDEHPESRPKAYEFGQNENASSPENDAGKTASHPFPPLSLKAIQWQLGIDEHCEAEIIFEEI